MLLAEIRGDRDYRRILFIIIMTLVSLSAAVLLGKWMSSSLYQNVNRELYEVNTYRGQLEKIRYIFSGVGIAAFVAGLCGKVLYMGIATYGAAYWGICYLAEKCWKGIRRKRGSGGIAEAFVLLTVLSQIVVSAVYNVIPDSCDSVTFGRYHDYVMPVLIAAGINGIARCPGRKKRCLLVTGLSFTALTAVVAAYVTGRGITGMKGYFMTGMCLFASEEHGAVRFYAVSCLAGIMCMCTLGFIIFLYKKSGCGQILYVIAALQLLAALRLGNQYIYPFNRLAREDIRLAQQIDKVTEKVIEGRDKNRQITYVDYNDISAIGLMQFALRDQTIRVVPEEQGLSGEAVGGESVVLLGAGDPAWEALQKRYDNEIIGGHFVLLYNDEETEK